MGKAVAGFIRPQAEQWVSEQLERNPKDVDADLARLIDHIGRLRSDDGGAIIATPRGAFTIDKETRQILAGRIEFFDPVRGPVVGGGSDENGEIHADETPVSIDRSAPVGGGPE